MRLIALIIALGLAANAHARPVSFPGGVMPMAEHSHMGTMANLTYSPTARLAYGIQSEYRRHEEAWFNGAIMNWMPYRNNQKSSQTNVYFRTGLGHTYTHGDDGVGGFVGFNADWESRRHLIAYENRYFVDGSDAKSKFEERFRVGIAPYIVNYEDLQPWFIVQVDHAPEDDEEVTVTPMLRVYKGQFLGEAGISHRGDLYTSVTLQF